MKKSVLKNNSVKNCKKTVLKIAKKTVLKIIVLKNFPVKK